MRPLELTLGGFRSYRRPTTFDLRVRRLVGIVGPIGSGKSTILDAIAFALYGKTPTFERDTKSLIHQQMEECHTQLWFEVDGQVWRAARGLRRKGASGHQLWRHASDDPEAQVLEHITGEKQVRGKVEQLLGMDFDAFCRSVLLAQNRFADFLKATPRARNEVLKGVFGYERFDEALRAAKARAEATAMVLTTLEREGSQLSDAREALVDAQGRLEQAAARASQLEAAKADVEAHAEAGREAAHRAVRVREAADVVVKAAEALPDGGQVQLAVERAVAAAEVIEAAEVTVEEAEDACKNAEAVYAAMMERAADQAVFAALVQQLDSGAHAASVAAERLDRLRAARDDTAVGVDHDRGLLEAAETKRSESERALAQASEAVAEAERTLHQSRHVDMARTLRGELVAGAPCPVCDQPVTTPPRAGRAPALTGAERSLTSARRAELKSRTQLEISEGAVTVAREHLASTTARAEHLVAQVEEAEEEVRALEADLAAVQSELVDRLGEGDPHALLEERRAELAEADRARSEATRRGVDARKRLESEQVAGQEAREALNAFATKLATAWGMLGEAREVSSAPGKLTADLTTLTEMVVERHEQLESELAAAGTEEGRARSALATLLGGLDVAPGEDFTTALAGAAAARAAAQERVGGLQATLASGADIEQRITEAERDRDLTARLVSDLQPSRFLAFLLEEERAALAELGSVHFDELSNGAYRFTDDDRFDVLDMNSAATERRADSLSGGETFLASLALALALAEMVARGGGRLDAFFLDEGFGSLDAEHLERAMDGIGRLVAGDTGRLVVLVSHVEQMKETLEDLIVLDKQDLTGDTIVISGASPAV